MKDSALDPDSQYLRKMQFLLWTHASEEKRRDALENKSSILIASNAIVIGAMTTFAFPLVSNNNPILWLQILLSILVFGFIIISIFYCMRILTPVFKQEERAKIMDIDAASEHNLFLFLNIARLDKTIYQEHIQALDSAEIIGQVMSEVHNLARLLVSRYQFFRSANFAFLAGLLSFALLAASKIFN